MRPFPRLLLRAALPLLALALLSGCSAVGTLNTLTPSHGFTVAPGVDYGPLDRQKLDIYTPASAAPAGGWPVVVFFYGGSWVHGDRADYKFVGAALASRGVVALVADYRLYPQVSYPDFLNDSAQAVAYALRSAPQLGGNPKRVFAMGHSAGGYNAAMVALDPRWLAATGHSPAELAGWIGLAGAYDFLPSDDPEIQPVFHHPNYPEDAEPTKLPRPALRPSFLATAVKDNVVDPERSTGQLARRLRDAGAPVTLRRYQGATHTTLIGAFAWPLRWIAPVADDVVGFIDATPAVR